MSEQTKFTSHEQYILAAPQDVHEILRKVQVLVEAALPKAERCISYNMPAYRAGKVFFYFATFNNHLGVYPPVSRKTGQINFLILILYNFLNSH